jgi:hypothetical protein
MAVLYPPDVLSQSQETLSGWKTIDENMTVGDLTQTIFTADLATAQGFEAQISTLEAQLTNLRNQRDDSYIKVWDHTKRVRSTVKGIYGDDSTQYEMVGGTRKSERKRPTRKAKT